MRITSGPGRARDLCVLALAAAVAAAACATGTGGPARSRERAAEPSSSSPSASRGGGAGLSVEYRHAGEAERWARDFLRERKLPQEVARHLNGQLDAPTAVRLRARSCGSSDISYDPVGKRVDVCYEFVDEVRAMFADAGRADVEGRTAGVVRETLYHEVAHALLGQLDLPYVGREEDVADQFAAYELLPQGRRGSAALLAAADNYALYAEEAGPDGVDFSGEHTPDAARSANYRCYLYGSAPATHERLVDGTHLSEDRAELCVDEYEDLERGWKKLLAPYAAGKRTGHRS
ncbi:DUF4344 domain-containing metallopeptidase [Streptomyces sp. NPDC054796]